MKKLIQICLVILLLSSIIGIFKYPLHFILLPLIIILYALLFFVLYFVVVNVAWILIPTDEKKIYKQNKIRFKIIVSVCLLLLLIIVFLINLFYLRGVFHFTNVLINVGILLFFVFLGWDLINPKKKKKILLYCTTSIFAISFLFSFINLKSNTQFNATSIEALKSLPYLKWVPLEGNIKKRGVTIYKQKLSYQGINIYNSSYSPNAFQIDMYGKLIHKWSAATCMNYGWQHVEINKSGDLFGIFKDNILIKLDWNSNVKWSVKGRFHHDISIDCNEDILTLSRSQEFVFPFQIPVPILCDYLTILSSKGKIKKKISFYEILNSKIPTNRFIDIYMWIIDPKSFLSRITRLLKKKYIITNDTPPDIFHINTVEVINKDLNDLFRKGNILFCSKYLNLVGVIDINTEKLVWSWGEGYLEKPHHPTLLDSGNILIFDNGYERKYSRIIELNPLKEEIVWKYEASPVETFYTSWGGANQRLPNGNTLITESGKGRVFEITNTGEIIWEFFNPEIRSNSRESINRMMRIPSHENYFQRSNLEKEIR